MSKVAWNTRTQQRAWERLNSGTFEISDDGNLVISLAPLRSYIAMFLAAVLIFWIQADETLDFMRLRAIVQLSVKVKYVGLIGREHASRYTRRDQSKQKEF